MQRIRIKRGSIKNRNLYWRYGNMIDRCQNPKNKLFHRYGGRGITICEEWAAYGNFESWSLNNGFALELQLDRIDNNKGYSPDNCRWATVKVNHNNTEIVKNIKNNLTKEKLLSLVHLSIEEISKKCGCSRETVRNRIRDWNVPYQSKIVFPSFTKEDLVEHLDKSQTQIAKILHCDRSTIGRKMKRWNLAPRADCPQTTKVVSF